jgi:hypothetical protein
MRPEPLSTRAGTSPQSALNGAGPQSPVNGTVVATLALGAIAVASAIFLILELSQPYSGLFRLSPAGVIETLQALGS